MARTVSFRIGTPLASRVAEQSARWGLSNDSEVYRKVVEEWTRLQEHPGIRFVDGPIGRRAALVEGPDVWEVMMIVKDWDFQFERIKEAYPWLTDSKLATVLAYYEAYRDEIEGWLERNAQAAAELERELEPLDR